MLCKLLLLSAYAGAVLVVDIAGDIGVVDPLVNEATLTKLLRDGVIVTNDDVVTAVVVPDKYIFCCTSCSIN
jgi:hypothetical protein